VDTGRAAGAVAGAVVARFNPPLGLTLAAGAWVWGHFAKARAKERGAEVLPLTDQQATGLRFPPSHPKRGVLYIGHPLDPLRYYPAADFHRRVFENKLHEAVDLLAALGATQLAVQAERGWSQKFAASLSVPLEQVSSGDASGERRASAKSRILFRGTYPGTRRPRVPGDLVWYPREENWQFLARQRLERGLESFDLELSYMSDFGIDSKIGATTFLGQSLELGGKFVEQENTRWLVTGRF
jgi:hypothetical protein